MENGTNVNFSMSFHQDVSTCGNISVHDKTYNKQIRLVTLYLTFVIGVIGGVIVCVWILIGNFRYSITSLSRIKCLFLQLTFADLFVMFGAVLPQLIWEYQNQKEWLAGNFLCKFVKFVQSFSMMTSTNILVAMALDRYHVIRKPLKRPYSVLKIIAAAWLIAGVTSMPMLFVFHTETINNVTKCENIFRDKPKSHRQAFLTYICMIVFVFPVIILAFSYIGIFVTILRKAKERKQRHNTVDKLKENNFLRQNTYPTTFLKARTKTLKMTCVIVTMYIFCTLPYFVAEMIMSYGDHCSISRVLYGIFGVLVAANSTANPFVYLAFNVKIKHARKHTYSVNLARFDQNQTSVVSF